MADISDLVDGKVVKVTRQPESGSVYRVIKREEVGTQIFSFTGTGNLNILPASSAEQNLIVAHGQIPTFVHAKEWKTGGGDDIPRGLRTAWERWDLAVPYSGNGVQLVHWLLGADEPSGDWPAPMGAGDDVADNSTEFGIQFEYCHDWETAKQKCDWGMSTVYVDNGALYVLMTEASKEIMSRRINDICSVFFHMTPVMKHVGLGSLSGSMRDGAGDISVRGQDKISRPSRFVTLDPVAIAGAAGGRVTTPLQCEMHMAQMASYNYNGLKRKLACNTLFYRLLWQWVRMFGIDDGMSNQEFLASASMMLANYSGYGTPEGPAELGQVGGDNLFDDAMELCGAPFASSYLDLDPAAMTPHELKTYICLLLAMKIALGHGKPWLAEIELMQTSLHKPTATIQRLGHSLRPDYEMGAPVNYFLPITRLERGHQQSKELVFTTVNMKSSAFNKWTGPREPVTLGDVKIERWETARSRAEASSLKPWETEFARPVIIRDGMVLEANLAFRRITILGLPRPPRAGAQIPRRGLVGQFTTDSATVDGQAYLTKARSMINSGVKLAHLYGADAPEPRPNSFLALSSQIEAGELVAETTIVDAKDPWNSRGKFVTPREAVESAQTAETEITGSQKRIKQKRVRARIAEAAGLGAPVEEEEDD